MREFFCYAFLTMNEVLSKILDKGTEPTRQDIADLLESIGKPGEKKEEKKKAVESLYEEGAWRSINFQGVSAFEDLESYAQY